MKTRDYSDAGNTVLHIPKKIQSDIQERGFHLYEWISPDEVRLSVERDFLKAIKFIGIPLAIISIAAGFLSGLNILVFFTSIFLGMILVFLYLLFLSVRRSRLLSKSAFVVLTDSSISLGGKIHKLSEISGAKKDLHHIGETFEEDLFEKSQLGKSKKNLTQDVMEQLFGGYRVLFNMGDSRISFGNSRESQGGLLLLILLYTGYIAIMACIYFIGVIFLLGFGRLFVRLNSWYLVKKGQSVIKINSLFGKLDISSKDIYEEKRTISDLLTRAQKNDWQDGLFLEINTGIEKINSSAQRAVVEVLDLRNTITSSKYSDMFRFEIYNSWIKKQITKPLEDIRSLLEKNYDILEKTRGEIKAQIQSTKKPEHTGPLKLQLSRVEMQLQEVQTFIPKIQNSIDSLR